MKTVIDTDDIDDIAAGWVMRMDRGELGEGAQQQLDAWLEADSRHRGAFIRAQAIWSDMDRVAALNGGELSPSRHRWSLRGNVSIHRAAASIVCLIALVLASIGIYGRYLVGRESTVRGETRRLLLDDGSTLALNTSSVVQVKFDNDQRRIVLRAGEASFQVAHDEQRPFIVQAGDVSVRAVGTEFNVRMRPTGVAVTVTEGVVDILRSGAPDAMPLRRVSHNQEVLALREQPVVVEALSDAVIARRLAWREGRLVFEGERLANAVAEVNRYSNVAIVVGDEQLAAQSFVGSFRIGDARGFAYAAATAFDAHVTERDNVIYLSR